MLKPFQALWKNRYIIRQTTANDIKSRYAGSLLGIVWAVLYPLLFLGAYAFVYVFIFNARFEFMQPQEYVILIFCGLVPFIAFQDAMSAGTSCVVTNAGLMKNTMFPIEFVPVKTVLAALPMQFSGLGLAIIALVVMGRFTPFIFLVILIVFMQILFNIGMVWILSSIDVFFRDLQNVIGIIIMLLMMTSPIAYPTEFVPENLRFIVKLNPMYYIISCYQDVLMMGRFPRAEVFFPFIIMMAILFIGGYHFFIRLKRVFADNV